MNKSWLGIFFEWLTFTLTGAERGFLDLLSVAVPYAVPIIPAYLTYYHTVEQMNFPPWVAWTAAFVVEVLGLTSVSTAIRFYRHNQKYKKSDNKAPFWLALGVYIFYIIIVLVVNVILEKIAGVRNGWVIFAIALFSLLSFPSGVLISIRTQYAEMLEDITDRYSRKPNGPQPVPGASGAYTEKPASHYHDKILYMLEAEYGRSGQVLAPKAITSKLKLDHGRSKGYVSTLTSEWKKGKGI